MKQPRLPTGTSDPITYHCDCAASTSPSGGLVLLFYRYFASPPCLPSSITSSTTELFEFHTDLTQALHLGGKIRIADEGFNITVGGTFDAIHDYMKQCISHWSFAGLPIASSEAQEAFFKPTPGCACAFSTGPGLSQCSVRITAEITPMGVTNYIPSNWNSITYLKPAAFHQKCYDENDELVLVDVRNHYESRIGYFTSPQTGQAALRPEIRRFAQWPLYVRRRLASDTELLGSGAKADGEGKGCRDKAILTYCTGGIRCEKGARFLADSLSTSSSPDSARSKVYTLHGGIAAYLTWFDGEIASGRKQASDSLFKGRNYVFDARGSIGLESGVDDKTDPSKAVSTCHMCNAPSSHLSKCSSVGCHLILVLCETCELNSMVIPRCCETCTAVDGRSRPMCGCEEERERLLWGPGAEDRGGKLKSRKVQSKHKDNVQLEKRRNIGKPGEIKSTIGGSDGIEIQLKTI
jgi:predicted sulfurtransferase